MTEKEKQVPFITYAERYGMEKGREQGLEEGRREYLLKGIELALELKFGAEGQALASAVGKQTDLAVLEAVFNAIRPAASVEDVRKLLLPGGETAG
jgi:hypothetical protein